MPVRTTKRMWNINALAKLKIKQTQQQTKKTDIIRQS